MRVAVLGLGRMGTPIAERLEHAGHELSVWNRSPPRQGHEPRTPICGSSPPALVQRYYTYSAD